MAACVIADNRPLRRGEAWTEPSEEDRKRLMNVSERGVLIVRRAGDPGKSQG